jgi:ribonuclease HII
MNMDAGDERARLFALTRYERGLWDAGVRYVAGVDEVGRGPLAGPVVTACVIMPPEPLVEGVRDSKAVKSEAQREALYERILERAVAYSVGVVENPVIDEVNILEATRRAFLQAIRELTPQPEHVLADHVHGLMLPCAHTMLKKGDALSYCVAAASIVAKVTRDRMMREFALEYPQYGFERHKGYCTRAHEEAIRAHGLCPLHRRSFCAKFADVR